MCFFFFFSIVLKKMKFLKGAWIDIRKSHLKIKFLRTNLQKFYYILISYGYRTYTLKKIIVLIRNKWKTYGILKLKEDGRSLLIWKYYWTKLTWNENKWKWLTLKKDNYIKSFLKLDEFLCLNKHHFILLLKGTDKHAK